MLGPHLTATGFHRSNSVQINPSAFPPGFGVPSNFGELAHHPSLYMPHGVTPNPVNGDDHSPVYQQYFENQAQLQAAYGR